LDCSPQLNESGVKVNSSAKFSNRTTSGELPATTSSPQRVRPVADWQPVLAGELLAFGREFLLQIERELPIAIHVSAPDHQVDSVLDYIAVFFRIVTVAIRQVA